MAAKTAIEWTDQTWNPTVGCTQVSPGCDHCYAKAITERFSGKGSFDQVVLHENRLNAPLHWRKPRMVFVNSMSDLFHQDVPDEFIARVFAVMAITPQHTYQVLTKRHGRMRSLLNTPDFWTSVGRFARHFGYHFKEKAANYLGGGQNIYDTTEWETRRRLDNVWLGVSVEDQKRADLRIPALLDTPAAVRFVSAEPLLGPIDLHGPADAHGHRARLTYWLLGRPGWGPDVTLPSGLAMRDMTTGPRLDWVIVGGESGPGARPMDPDWACVLRDQCASAGVAFFFKQWGGRSPKAGGRLLDGRTYDEFPTAEAR